VVGRVGSTYFEHYYRRGFIVVLSTKCGEEEEEEAFCSPAIRCCGIVNSGVWLLSTRDEEG